MICSHGPAIQIFKHNLYILNILVPEIKYIISRVCENAVNSHFGCLLLKANNLLLTAKI